MTPEQLQSRLQDPDVVNLDDAAAAKRINETAPKAFHMFFINKRTMAGLFGPFRAAAVMKNLKDAAANDASGGLQLVYDLLNTLGNNDGDSGGADVGSEIGQAQVDALKPIMGFSDEEAAAIKALGYRDADPVSHIDVARARGRDERC